MSLRRMMVWPVALCVLLIWQSSAHAEAQASAALTDFHIEVIDLDLSDGRTSEFTPLSSMSDVNIGGFFTSPNYSYGYLGDAASISGNDGNGSASAFTLAYTVGVGPEAHANSNVLQEIESAWASAHLLSPGVRFWITAHTKVVFTGKAQLAASTTGPSDSASADALLTIALGPMLTPHRRHSVSTRMEHDPAQQS